MSPLDRPQPPAPAERDAKSSPLSIILALLAGTVISAILALLTFNVFGVMLLVVACLFAFIALNYIVWGRWLQRTIRKDAEADKEP